VATLARSATQAQLMLFFVNPPLIALSGGFTPIEAMPKWIQPFTYLNPIAHFAGLARAVMVRGSELDWVLLPRYRLTGTSTNPPPVATRTRRSTRVERLVGTVPR
jgi:ABC-type polysaccharide/polyol phosphate export permease